MVMSRKILRDIRRVSDFEDAYNRLGNREYKWPGGERPDGAPIFGTIRDLLCFAAFLGYHLNRRESLDGLKTEAVPEEVFAKYEDALECVRTVALAEAKDQVILAENNVDEMVRIFEEYAHGGMKVIQRYLMDLPTDILGADAIIEGLRKEGLVNRQVVLGTPTDLRGVKF
jgi:dnd system-associated protein 4